jgi:ABC-2 type transport system permease protein
MIKLVRSELLKIRTTNIWWIFAILLVVMVGLSFLVNAAQADFYLNNPAADPTQSHPDVQAASLFTSGQYFGLVFVLILGALVVTNEFFHQTATTTFLTTPKRTVVILAKLVAAIGVGFVFWLAATVLSVVAGTLFLNAEGYGPQLGVGSVWRSILLNLLGYAVWAIVGVGLGALIRSQIATVVVGIVAYFVTGTVAQITAEVLKTTLHWGWATKVVMVLPATASQLMIQGNGELSNWLPQWAGAVILIAWGVVAGFIGTAITRTRDIT